MKLSNFSILGIMIILCMGSRGIDMLRKHPIKSWINTQYIECLKNKLPCECETLTSGPFVLIMDTSLNSTSFGVRWRWGQVNEFDSYGFRKESESRYDIFVDLSNNEFGSILLGKDQLYFMDSANKKSTFVPFGKSENRATSLAVSDDDSGYTMENISQLNKAFIKRHYPRLQKILNEDSLSCSCSNGLGTINVISSPHKLWIVEQRRDSVVLYDFEMPPYKSVPPIIKKKIYKSYKW
ncbi:MAG: hypothetical protein WDO15_29385 [Bacteroidota bacterium]